MKVIDRLVKGLKGIKGDTDPESINGVKGLKAVNEDSGHDAAPPRTDWLGIEVPPPAHMAS